ncbi:MAG: prepilin peptidase [Chloroflexi bacterium]|nr:prepilin peptidase [Chloroflexota bacterium]
MTDMLAVLLTVAVLAYAVRADIKYREVSNIPWLVLALAGAALLALRASHDTSLALRAGVSVGATLGVTYLFYRFSLFGAADAKCLIALALLFPAPPSISFLAFNLPVPAPPPPGVFPFALTVLMNSALLALSVPLFLGARNLLDVGLTGCWRNPGAVFTGYRVPVSRLAGKKHVRLAQPLPGAAPRKPAGLRGAPIDRALLEQLAGYQREGKIGDKVWITPELPFMVFIGAGFVAALLAGNLAFALTLVFG